jgi:excisionase family DNA binding protein
MEAAVITGLERGESVRTIADRLHLTEDSIRWRARQLGLSLRDGWYSRQQITRLLGVNYRHVNRWMRAGQLPVRRHGTRWTKVREEDFKQFIAQYAGLLFDPSDVQNNDMRRLAETSALANGRRRAGSNCG